MAQIRANGPYIWVTWLPKLLSGLNSCEWASWFKAQHYSDSWARMPSDFDLSKWLTSHTALLNELRGSWERQGYSVLTEDQNRFSLRGSSAVLAGKCGKIIVIDAKPGRPSHAHGVQVMLYMYTLPRALERYRGLTLTGQVAYSDHVVDIPADGVDKTFVRNTGQLITRLARGGCPALWSASSAKSPWRTARSAWHKVIQRKVSLTTSSLVNSMVAPTLDGCTSASHTKASSQGSRSREYHSPSTSPSESEHVTQQDRAAGHKLFRRSNRKVRYQETIGTLSECERLLRMK